ncbi:MAG TPA: helix-turn-helix transcriptional regulator [Jiangellaceae bacterium]
MTTMTSAAGLDASVDCLSMHRALGQVELAAGRPELAVRHFKIAIAAAGDSAAGLFVVPDLVEAAVRAGMPERARGPLGQFDGRVATLESPLLHALSARAHALLTSGFQADAEFRRALELHRRADAVVERARTELLYGEYLRRARRRTDAREFLAAALETFQRTGALTWAERARIELQAAEQTNDHETGSWGGLTPQQRRIVEAVGNGASNREVAAQLFLSPRTVDYHLRNVYIRLGVRSRAELIRFALTAHGGRTEGAGRREESGGSMTGRQDWCSY